MKPLSTSKYLTTGITDASIPPILMREDGNRPRWLLTSYSAVAWVVTDIGDKPNLTIRFDVRLPNGVLLTEYHHFVESIKRIVYGIRTGPLMEVESGSVQAQVASNLILLARWMIANQIERFEDLTRVDIREYVQLAAFGAHSILNSEGVLNLHLERIFAVAAFDEDDTTEKRRAKAMAAFPFNTGSNERQVFLGRQKLLCDAGLDGVSFTGKNSVLSHMLDDVEALCGFYVTKAGQARMNLTSSIDEFDDEVVSEEQLRRLIMPFEYLYRHRRYLDDAIQAVPFPASSARAEARKLGKVIGRTATVPIKQAATIIERSIRWVLDYAPILIELKNKRDSFCETNEWAANKQFAEELRLRNWPDDSPGSPFPILPGHWTMSTFESAEESAQAISLRQGMTLPVAINFLLTACAIVIAAFSARRAAEVGGLKFGCIERDDTGNPWMSVFIYKTLQQDSAIPVPEVVASAIAVLEQLSEKARNLTRTPYLFQVNLPGTDICQGISQDGAPVFRLGTYLRKFGYFIDVPELDDGTRWTFRPHQFRRFFAILYVWIYELGDWAALSYHLRHFNPEMTRRYVSDPELGHIIFMADREHTAQILVNATLGKGHVNGHEGKRLKEAAKRLYDRMSQRLQVVPERKFAQRIVRFVERAGITLHALPWGYCAGSPDSKKGTCSCAPDQDTPDLGAATVSTCNECVFGVRTDAFLPYLKMSRQFHSNVAQASNTPIILRRASETICRELDEYEASVTPKKNTTEIAS